MKSSLLLFALLIGCQPTDAPPRVEETADAPPTTSATVEDGLTDRVWMRADSTGRPGVMRIFLSGGTLLEDSCWETYRLSTWSLEPDNTLRWQEDLQEIRADVLALNEEELTLRLHLTSGTEEQQFVQATVPYVCPDIPR